MKIKKHSFLKRKSCDHSNFFCFSSFQSSNINGKISKKQFNQCKCLDCGHIFKKFLKNNASNKMSRQITGYVPSMDNWYRSSLQPFSSHFPIRSSPQNKRTKKELIQLRSRKLGSVRKRKELEELKNLKLVSKPRKSPFKNSSSKKKYILIRNPDLSFSLGKRMKRKN